LGETPLHYASQGTLYGPGEASVDVARLLLEHGADVNAKAKSGTPFDRVSYRRSELAQLLLEHGARLGSGANFFKL